MRGAKPLTSAESMSSLRANMAALRDGARELEIDGQRYAMDRLECQHELQRSNGRVIEQHGSKNQLSVPVLIAIKSKSESMFLSPSDS